MTYTLYENLIKSVRTAGDILNSFYLRFIKDLRFFDYYHFITFWFIVYIITLFFIFLTVFLLLTCTKMKSLRFCTYIVNFFSFFTRTSWGWNIFFLNSLFNFKDFGSLLYLAMKNFMSFSSYIKTDSASAESLERLNTQTVNLKKTCVESESDELNFVLSQIDHITGLF